MLTNVHDSRLAIASMRPAIALLIPQLIWRHSGLGMLQAYIKEGTDEEVRVHIWDPTLRQPGIEDSGLLHDHRFHMTSHVLHGSIVQAELQVLDYGTYGSPVWANWWRDGMLEGRYVLHEVLHARKAMADGSNCAGGMRELPGEYLVRRRDVAVYAGQSYDFPAREFHGTWHDGLTITVVHKRAQTDQPARILAPAGAPVVHAFANPLPPAAWRGTLESAAAALRGAP